MDRINSNMNMGRNRILGNVIKRVLGASFWRLPTVTKDTGFGEKLQI